MKKHLVIAAGLATLSTGAFASVARMTALNQDTRGSYYMNDSRNAWRMANHVNTNTNFVTTEWGSDGTAGSAEGGFFRTGNSLNYGLYLNNSVYGNVDNSSSGNPARMDLFLGANANMDWGLRLGYEAVEDTDEDGSGFDLGLSATVNGFDLWLNYTPAVDGLTAGSNENEADMNLGFTYGLNDYTLYAEYEVEGGTNAANTDDTTTITLGAGRAYETSGGATVFYDMSIVSTSGVGFSTTTDRLAIPVTFGVEARANSWLTWRASLQQSIFGSLDADGSETSVRTTTLGAGASLHWGNLHVDGTLSQASQGNLGTDGNFLSSVSATYMF